MWDVLGLGAVALDHLLYVASYPPPDTKVTVLRDEQQCGGLTATALVAAARLGARCAYAGQLGEDTDSHFVCEAMRREGIDLSWVKRDPCAGPVRSTIVVGAQPPTRNVFTCHPLRFGAHPAWPPETVIRQTRVLLVDHLGVEGMVRAARIARAAGVAVVSDVERILPGVEPLLEVVDHVIAGWQFAAAFSGAPDPSAAVRALWNASRKAVVVTLGAEGCVFTTDGSAVQHFPAFSVVVVDTTGCGDVFHGAYCAALARGETIPACIRIASAAAALKATRPGAQAGAPSRAQLDAFLAAYA